MKRYPVYICKKCGDQKWFSGTCDTSGCFGTVVGHQALLLSDILDHGAVTQEQSVGAFVDSLVESSRLRSG